MICFNQPAIDQDLHPERRTFAPVVLPALLSTYLSVRRHTIKRASTDCLVPVRFFALPGFEIRRRPAFTGTTIYARYCSVSFQETPYMNAHIQTQDAIRTLTNAFAPMNCLIMAARKGCFSFTIVNEHGIARHSERLYPDQYASAEPLQAVIERTRQALTA
jgi:hypothetical protein